MQNNYSNQNVEYAGFWVRLAAYCIDSIIVGCGLLIVRLIIGGMSLLGGQVFQAKVLFQYTLKDVILYICQILYFVLLTYYTGTTLGKWLMNLRVVSAEEGQKLSFLDVLYRETIGRFLCGATLGIGYLIAGLGQEKQGLHDRLCDTRVIYGKQVKIYPVYKMPPMPRPTVVYGTGVRTASDPVYEQNMPPQNPEIKNPEQQGQSPVSSSVEEQSVQGQLRGQESTGKILQNFTQSPDSEGRENEPAEGSEGSADEV